MKRLLFLAVEVEGDKLPRTPELCQLVEQAWDGLVFDTDDGVACAVEVLAVDPVPGVASKSAHAIRRERKRVGA